MDKFCHFCEKDKSNGKQKYDIALSEKNINLIINSAVKSKCTCFPQQEKQFLKILLNFVLLKHSSNESHISRSLYTALEIVTNKDYDSLFSEFESTKYLWYKFKNPREIQVKRISFCRFVSENETGVYILSPKLLNDITNAAIMDIAAFFDVVTASYESGVRFIEFSKIYDFCFKVES